MTLQTHFLVNYLANCLYSGYHSDIFMRKLCPAKIFSFHKPLIFVLQPGHHCNIQCHGIQKSITSSNAAWQHGSVDVSFISLSHVLPVIWRFLAPGGRAVCLIKPQFEAGREKVGKKGVVRDPDTHREVIEKVISLAGENQFAVKGLDFSPVKGPEGNLSLIHI